MTVVRNDGRTGNEYMEHFLSASPMLDISHGSPCLILPTTL